MRGRASDGAVRSVALERGGGAEGGGRREGYVGADEGGEALVCVCVCIVSDRARVWRLERWGWRVVARIGAVGRAAVGG